MRNRNVYSRKYLQAFPCPEAFRPERFLTPENRAKRVDEFIPFSIGKRMCPGESLTKMELFLMTANIFNRFTVNDLLVFMDTALFRMNTFWIKNGYFALKCNVVNFDIFLSWNSDNYLNFSVKFPKISTIISGLICFVMHHLHVFNYRVTLN